MTMRVLRSRKGISNVIGALFLIAIFFLAFNLLIWYETQQRALYQSGRDLQNQQQLTMLEEFQVTKILISSSKPNATILNSGPVTIHIVDIVITSRSDVPMWHNIYSTSYYIDPGSSVTNIGQNLPVPQLDAQKTYSVTFITERGNGVSAIYSPTPVTSGAFATFGNLGYLSVSFTQEGFRFTSPVQGTPLSAWAVASSKVCGNLNVIWWVTFTNHGVYDAKILKWSVAQMWQFRSGGGGGTATDFYIVGTASVPNGLVAYVDNSIIVPASTTGDWQTGGTPTTLKFSATAAGRTSGQTLGCAYKDIWDFFIVVSYTYNNQQFNQLTPYAAMVVTS